MNYDEYVRVQTVVHGQVAKPEHYHLSERKAIDILFDDIHKSSRILDVGCGVGQALSYLTMLGYDDVTGIELNEQKALIAQSAGLDVVAGDILHYTDPHIQSYDVIYSSHSFEHMFNPVQAMTRLSRITTDDAIFIFILPYVDTGDQTAHCASSEIGLRVHDEGHTVMDWFITHGMYITEVQFSDVREPEIWLKCRKEK